jgi:hypothetical protein
VYVLYLYTVYVYVLSIQQTVPVNTVPAVHIWYTRENCGKGWPESPARWRGLVIRLCPYDRIQFSWETILNVPRALFLMLV